MSRYAPTFHPPPSGSPTRFSGPGADRSGSVFPQIAQPLKLWPPSTCVVHLCRPNMHASFFIIPTRATSVFAV